ncbi:Uncharacterized protein FWK35_00017574 [Aphis craccivora]|uniref:Uncharacterized protein n=1 Tax=Aphis craccivora TaxID=307492 RepID=A0A6G0YCM0_APHCR|nr:Uncharacterized protein FWK35_00017574 [Aphis craccivora]
MYVNIHSNILDSERSDKCIDFTMLTYRNNALIFNFSSFSGSKVNLVSAFGRSFFEIPNSVQKRQELP